MNIAAAQISLGTKSYDIFLSGCAGSEGVRCSGCHNPELWCFDVGTNWRGGEYLLPKILQEVREAYADSLISNISIMGGEPLDNNHEELEAFVKILWATGVPIVLYTGKELDDVPYGVRYYTVAIKTGRYEENNLCGVTDPIYGVTLASYNQKILYAGQDY